MSIQQALDLFVLRHSDHGPIEALRDHRVGTYGTVPTK